MNEPPPPLPEQDSQSSDASQPTEPSQSIDTSRQAETGLLPRSPNPELSLIGSVREWTDLFPWLRLFKVYRLVGAPLWLISVLLCTLFWYAVLTLFKPGSVWIPLWTLTISMLVGLPLIRAGGLLVAGKPMPSLGQTIGLTRQRLFAAIGMLVIPMAVIGGLTAAGWVTGQIALALNWIAPAMQWIATPILACILLLTSSLGILSVIAIPIGWSAIMLEQRADAIDAISRGFEYVCRRLLIAAGLLVLSAAIVAPMVLLGMVISNVSVQTSQYLVAPEITSVSVVLKLVPITLGFMLTCGVIGGIYLLLRQSAGGQEAEDVWILEDRPKPPSLPSVQATQ